MEFFYRAGGPMDWKEAKIHFDTVRQNYLELDGVQGVNLQFALRMIFEPLNRRYESGERSPELYEKMIGVK
jgi:hypothetical protein